MTDTASPLTSLRESFTPRLGQHKVGNKNRSLSVKTARDDELLRPVTPGGILDGYLSETSDYTVGKALGGEGEDRAREALQSKRRASSSSDADETIFPSMEGASRRFFGEVLGEGGS
jgi:hypothetical protein